MVAVALTGCAHVILCSLSAPARAALLGLVEQYKGLIEIELTALNAQLVVFNIVLAPLQAARNIADLALDAARGAARLLPTAVIAGCLDLGDLTLGLERVVEPTVSEAKAFIDDLEHYLSLKEELEAIILELTALEALLGNIVATIQVCDG